MYKYAFTILGLQVIRRRSDGNRSYDCNLPSFMGKILPTDIGKQVFYNSKTGNYQVENDEQKAIRYASLSH